MNTDTLREADAEIDATERLLRIGEVARLMGLGVKKMQRLADAGEISSVRFSRRGHRMFRPSDVTAYRRRLGLVRQA
jgi:excisionase family DNA binding protein